LAQLQPENRVGWKRYVIKSGDSLGQIAERHNVKTSALQRINKLKSHSIRAGRHLIIPVSSQDPSHYHYSLSQRNTRKTLTGTTHYKVRSGDNLWTISRKLGVNYKDLARWNSLDMKSLLKPGTQLKAYRGSKYRKSVQYTVKSGDSLSAIAKQFGTSVKSIMRLNKIKQQHLIQPGQAILVRRG
jgi:membrane-bound lytic murein transglycosylase D